MSYKTNFHVLHLRIVKFFGFSWVFVIGEWGLNRSFTKTKVVENWQEWVIIIVLLPYDNNRGNRELVQNTMTSLWYYHQNQLHASKPTDAKKKKIKFWTVVKSADCFSSKFSHSICAWKLYSAIKINFSGISVEFYQSNLLWGELCPSRLILLNCVVSTCKNGYLGEKWSADLVCKFYE